MSTATPSGSHEETKKPSWRGWWVIALSVLGALGVVGVLVLSGDGDPADTPIGRAMISDYLEDEDLPGGQTEARCVARSVVRGIGEDRFAELGITPDNFSDVDLEDVGFSDAEVGVIADSFVDCADMSQWLAEATLKEISLAYGSEEVTCVAEHFDDEDVRKFLREPLSGVLRTREFRPGDAEVADVVLGSFVDALFDCVDVSQWWAEEMLADTGSSAEDVKCVAEHLDEDVIREAWSTYLQTGEIRGEQVRMEMAAGALAVCGVESDGVTATGGDADTVTLVAYDSFPADDPGDPDPIHVALDEFAAETGIEVEVLNAGDTGTMLSKAVLIAGNPRAT